MSEQADRVEIYKANLKKEIEKRLSWLEHKYGNDYEGGQETAFEEVLDMLDDIKVE